MIQELLLHSIEFISIYSWPELRLIPGVYRFTRAYIFIYSSVTFGDGVARREMARIGGQEAEDSQDLNVADMVLGLWSRSQRQTQTVKADRNREKIQTWLDSTG